MNFEQNVLQKKKKTKSILVVNIKNCKIPMPSFYERGQHYK